MKKLVMMSLLGAAATAAALAPQSLEIIAKGISYRFNAEQAGKMNYSGGESLLVQGCTFSLKEIDSAEVIEAEAEDNTVSITYSGATASVIVAGNIARYVTATVDGARVSIAQADGIDNEITYRLTGASECGSLTLTGSYKSTVELAGVELTSTSGAALDIQNGKRINLRVADNTANSLTDAAGGSQKGAITCKGHLEIKGHGSLTVSGKTAHAIHAKEYIELKNADIKIVSAAKDGLNCNQYFAMESGSLTIDNVGDDALQCSFKDETDREAEDTGTVTVAGGTLTLTSTGKAAKGIKADGNISITGGTLTIAANGQGKWDSAASKTKAAAALSADGNIEITGGTLNLTATQGGGKGISCNGEFTMNGGEITIATSGGMYVYSNGTEYQNYTSSADRISSSQKSSPKGVKADGNVNISAGSIKVTTKGNGGEGIESKKVLTIAGGTVVIRAYDDGINSASHMYITGGEIESIATNNDGLDSNGNMYISGGTVRAFGAGAPECGIDVNEEERYTLYLTGGNILGVGGNNSVPGNSQSTQAYVSVSASVTAGSTVEIKNGSELLGTFTIPADYTSSGSSSGGGGRPGGWGGGGWGGQGGGSSLLISVPGLTANTSYTITCGSTSTTATARIYK